MATVTVEPLGVEFDTRPDETLMEAAHRAGLYWPTVCGGNGYCNRCFIQTDPESPAFSPLGQEEREELERVRWRITYRPGERLACRVRILADVTVTKRGVAVAAESGTTDVVL
jgi:2Fe-2S ferredoxin